MNSKQNNWAHTEWTEYSMQSIKYVLLSEIYASSPRNPTSMYAVNWFPLLVPFLLAPNFWKCRNRWSEHRHHRDDLFKSLRAFCFVPTKKNIHTGRIFCAIYPDVSEPSHYGVFQRTYEMDAFDTDDLLLWAFLQLSLLIMRERSKSNGNQWIEIRISPQPLMVWFWFGDDASSGGVYTSAVACLWNNCWIKKWK